MTPALPVRPVTPASQLRVPSAAPSRDAFTPRERRFIETHRTPLAIQRWLNDLPYNGEHAGETLRTFRGVLRDGRAHCLEAALTAAVVLEQHGWPPLVLSFESVDRLDHVIFAYRTATGWGSVARSRDPGLHGRRPVFPTARALARSYADPYVDFTGRVTGYAVVNLNVLGGYDWRRSAGNVWKVERLLIDWPHHRLPMAEHRYRALHARYVDYRGRHGRKPVYYEGRHAWTPLPGEFRKAP
ncbi:MAG: hypothetical protein Q8L86_07920 [Vicinamibacterales bacterium]|nr:hypothetical protein [Vicinamibacterales bacterium]